jgi:hypothetical protein
MAEGVEDFAHAIDGIGKDTVGFEQKFDAEILRPADRFVQLLADAEQSLVIGQVMAEIGFRIAFGGDDLFDPEEMREFDRLDDLRRPVTIRRGRIEQVRVGADARQGESELLDHIEDGRGMRIEAEGGRETVFRAEGRPIVVVGEVRVIEAEFTDEFELPPHGREWLDEGEAADFHGSLSGWIPENSFHSPSSRSGAGLPERTMIR